MAMALVISLLAGMCVLGREVLRMQIVRNDLRLKIEKIFVMLDAFRKRTQRFEIFEIADVMADEGVIVARQAKCIF